jgi:hypothetical protein
MVLGQPDDAKFSGSSINSVEVICLPKLWTTITIIHENNVNIKLIKFYMLLKREQIFLCDAHRLPPFWAINKLLITVDILPNLNALEIDQMTLLNGGPDTITTNYLKMMYYLCMILELGLFAKLSRKKF